VFLQVGKPSLKVLEGLFDARDTTMGATEISGNFITDVTGAIDVEVAQPIQKITRTLPPVFIEAGLQCMLVLHEPFETIE